MSRSCTRALTSSAVFGWSDIQADLNRWAARSGIDGWPKPRGLVAGYGRDEAGHVLRFLALVEQGGHLSEATRPSFGDRAFHEGLASGWGRDVPTDGHAGLVLAVEREHDRGDGQPEGEQDHDPERDQTVAGPGFGVQRLTRAAGTAAHRHEEDPEAEKDPEDQERDEHAREKISGRATERSIDRAPSVGAPTGPSDGAMRALTDLAGQ